MMSGEECLKDKNMHSVNESVIFWTAAFSTVEKIMAPLMFLLAYVYVYMSTTNITKILFDYLLVTFTVGFLAYGEAMYWNRKRSGESILFFVLTVLIAVAACFGIGRVWDDYAKIFFLHLFAVYWVLERSGCLTKGETSHMFAWDGFNAFVTMPFVNYGLWAATLVQSVFQGKRKNFFRSAVSIAAIIIGLILFAISMAFLKESDANFAAFMDNFEFRLNFLTVYRAILCLFVASYLYGLFGGCFRAKSEYVKKPGEWADFIFTKINKVPNGVWMGMIALFSVFYIVYFALQGSYMLDAFAMLLPEKYTFSEYARRGFGEMCAVMIVNFILMWFAFRTAEKKSMSLKIFGAALMAESLVFALIAFLKLLMYIQAYGFTPLRLQSVWLVLVLSYACVCIPVSIFTGKKTAKYWFDGSALTLAVLTLV